jgi:hypothetical protein
VIHAILALSRGVVGVVMIGVIAGDVGMVVGVGVRVKGWSNRTCLM